MPDDFWSSLHGLLLRAEALAHDLIWGTLNDTTIEAASLLPVEGVTVSWTTMADDKVCAECDDNDGDYDIDEFLPECPAHPNCRCYWDVASGADVFDITE